ncbi:MAG: hypothetical protein IJW82_02895 [Clostridia bacterium]|nr:hypothetical protein [Clostridia bacterium]
MKITKWLLSICSLCLVITILLFNLGETRMVNASKDIYGVIDSYDVLLFDKNQTPLFVLPKSYYVKILNEKDEFYFVEYKQVQGYAYKNKIKLTKTPENPFMKDFVFNLKFDDYLYVTANSNSQKIPLNSKTNLEFIGQISGDTLKEYNGNVWYYVKVQNQDIFGYVYSPFTTGISGLVNNTENQTILVSTYDEIKNMSPFTFVVLVILLCIPMLIIVSLLFIPKIKKFKKDDFLSK